MRAKQLAGLRAKAGLTQAQLADLLGVARVTVARWEINQRRITRPMEKAILLALGEIPPAPPAGMSWSESPTAQAVEASAQRALGGAAKTIVWPARDVLAIGIDDGSATGEGSLDIAAIKKSLKADWPWLRRIIVRNLAQQIGGRLKPAREGLVELAHGHVRL